MKVLRSKKPISLTVLRYKVKKVVGKSNEVQVKSTLVKKYFVTLQSTQKTNEVL